MTPILTRRGLIRGAAALGLSGFAGAAFAADHEDCFTEVRQGRLRGIRAGGVDTYRGVPYAGGVSGSNRFKTAMPPAAWTGTRDATRFGAPAMQPPGGYYGVGEPAPAEECLVLNVWAPVGGAPNKPVMVYSHGGGYVTGSAASPVQDGANLARENDVVVIGTNHRLGLFGYLYLDQLAGEEYAGSGNRGVQDIALALKWIQQNVAAFGGDANNVMIFGESGGGLKTACLYAMPAAAPYFHKASIESGPGIRIIEPDVAAETTRLLLTQLGLAPRDWRKLLDMPAATLLDVQMKLAAAQGGRPGGGRRGLGEARVGSFGAVHDGHVMPHHPFDPGAPALSRGKPLLVGGNEDEQMFFSASGGDMAAFTLDEAGLMDRMNKGFGADAGEIVAAYRGDRPQASPSEIYFAIFSDQFSGQGSTVIAERKTAQGGAPAYRYIFAFDQGMPVGGTGKTMGAMHALDIPFKFDNMDSGAPAPGLAPFAGPRPERYLAGKAMSRFWASFARTGKPSAPGQPNWPAYDLKRRPTMYIDAQCRVVDDSYGAERRYWEKKS